MRRCGSAASSSRTSRSKGATAASRSAPARIYVEAGLFGALFDGASAVDAVELRDVRVEVDVSNDGLPESLRELREALSALEAPSVAGSPEVSVGAGASERAVSIDGASILLRDEIGPLVTVEGGHVRATRARFLGGASSIAVGGAPYDTVELNDAEADLAHEPEGWTVRALGIDGGTVMWARRAGDLTGATTGGRLGHALEAVRGPATDAPEDPATSRSWLDRFAIGARARVGPIDVRARTDDGEVSIVQRLDAEVERVNAHELRTRGSGAPGHDGSLRWELVVAPEELRANGSISFDALPLALVAPLLPSVPWYEPEESSLSGELEVEGRGADRIDLRGNVSLANGGLASDRIAPDPVRGLDVAFDGQGRSFRPRGASRSSARA